MTCVKCDLVNPPILFIDAADLISGLGTVEYLHWLNVADYIDGLNIIYHFCWLLSVVYLIGLNIADYMG